MSSIEFQIYPGFAIPFVSTAYPESGSLNDALRQVFLEREARGAEFANARPTMSAGSGLFESRFDLFRWDVPSVARLRDFCTAAVFRVVAELNGYGKDEMDALEMSADAWFHVMRKGSSFGQHNHPMASWSGIYCVDTGYPAGQEPESGEVHFSHPNQTAGMFTDLGVANIRTPWSLKSRRQRLLPGELVIFPSWLVHQVTPYTGDGERITVAFNAWFKAVG